MKVHDVMTAPALTCTPATSLGVAAHLMEDGDCGTLPVVGPNGKLVGMITDRDICLAMSHSSRNATHIAVHEVMTPKVSSALLDDDVHNALATMKRTRIRRLPVCDQSGNLRGILSIEDLIVRGLQGDGIHAGDIVDALQAMCVRTPVATKKASVKH